MDSAELFQRFIASRLTAHRAPATLAWYRELLPPLVAACPGELTTEAIEEWLASAPSAASARAWLRAVRAMCNWAEKRYRIPSPAAAITPPRPSNRLPRVFTPGELRRILGSCSDPRDLAAVTVLLDTGVRIGELASIKTENIETDALTVFGKTGQRRVPLTPESRAALMRIAPPGGPVFCSWPGRIGQRDGVARPMTVATLKDRVRRIVERAGITGEKTGPHTFRHTFATMYLRAGGDLYRLQRLMGHTNIKQTMVYLHLADPDAFEEHARLSPLTQLRRAN